ncbi:MAG: alanine racemase [Actinomycetota bacterium]|jgi:D-serine deaminase-like pyridoxal phosphate-dependent protein|nr:alanine racemase [Actinomycetota bacterium]
MHQGPAKTSVLDRIALIGQPVEILETPCLVVDLDVLDRNVANMAQTVLSHGVNLRPHIKTHKTPSIGNKQLDSGAIGITAAKLTEAWVFADAGFDDILLAYQVVGAKKIQSLIELSQRVRVRSCVDNLEVSKELSQRAVSAGLKLQVLLDVDTGLQRTGCSPEEALELGISIAKLDGLDLVGVFSFAGYRPGDPNPDVRRAWARNEAETAVALAVGLRQKGVPAETVSVSGTPGTPFAIEVDGVTEVRPGTYVFGDMNYARLGVNSIDDCALRIRSTVVSRPAKDRAVIDAGTKVLAADRPSVINGPSFGHMPRHADSQITRAWEEHSVANLDKSDFTIKVGDVVEIIPNHVCVVTNLANHWYGVRDGVVREVHDIPARGLVE